MSDTIAKSVYLDPTERRLIKRACFELDLKPQDLYRRATAWFLGEYPQKFPYLLSKKPGASATTVWLSEELCDAIDELNVSIAPFAHTAIIFYLESKCFLENIMSISWPGKKVDDLNRLHAEIREID